MQKINRTDLMDGPAEAYGARAVSGAAILTPRRRVARLTLRPAHSRGHQFVTRYPKASALSLPP